jgi:hypothetical protein
MIAEIRTYDIKPGMLEPYLELYNKQIVPNHELYGMKIIGAWVDREKNQITWIRIFKDREERTRKLKEYAEGSDRTAVYPIALYLMKGAVGTESGMNVRVVDNVLDPSPQPDDSVLKNDIAKKAYAAYEELRAKGALPATAPKG